MSKYEGSDTDPSVECLFVCLFFNLVLPGSFCNQNNDLNGGAKPILLFQGQVYKHSIGSSCSCVSFICLFIHFYLCYFSYYIICCIVCLRHERKKEREKNRENIIKG